MVAFGPASSLRALTDHTFEALGTRPQEVLEAQKLAVIAGLSTTPLVDPRVDRRLGIARVADRSLSPAVERGTRMLTELTTDRRRRAEEAPSHR